MTHYSLTMLASILAVFCPTCHAQEGERCRKLIGAPRAPRIAHRERIATSKPTMLALDVR